MNLRPLREANLRDAAARLRAPLPRVITTALFIGLLTFSVFLFRDRFTRYDLQGDDFVFVSAAQTWSKTWESLAVPLAVHFCPLFRLLTGAIVPFASRPSELRILLVPPTIAVFCFTLTAVYAFLERETERPLAGMVGVILFGLSSNLCDTWAFYASSSAQWALFFNVLTLLAARRFRVSGGVWPLVALVFLPLLAPCWWTIGIFAGPTAACYLMLTGAGPLGSRLRSAAVPLVGTAGYVVPVFAMGFWAGAAERVHWWQTACDIFRAAAEVLVLRNCGVALDPWSVEKSLVYIVGVIVVATWWFFRGAQRHLMWLGVCLWVISYGVVYGYSESSNADRAGRYQLAAQLALALFLAGGLKASKCAAGRISLGDSVVVIVCAVVFWCTHRNAIAQGMEQLRAPFQAMQLGQLDLVATEARRSGIGLDVLHEAIGPFKIEGAPMGFDGLSLLEDSLPAVTPTALRPPASELRRRLEQLFEGAE